jgi:hypothetical protein
MGQVTTAVVNYSKNFYNKENTDLYLNNNDIQIINLNRNFLTEEELSLLFLSYDALFLPYQVISSSGMMFDGLGHGKPFVALNFDFFKEFSALNLGLVSKRESSAYENEFIKLNKNYKDIENSVREFRKKINWSVT